MGEFDKFAPVSVSFQENNKKYPYNFVIGVVVILIVTLGILGQFSGLEIFSQIHSQVENVGQGGDAIIGQAVKAVDRSFAAASKGISVLMKNPYITEVSFAEIVRADLDIFKEYSQWIGGIYEKQIASLVQAIKTIF